MQMRAHAASHVLIQLSRKCDCRAHIVANKNCQVATLRGTRQKHTVALRRQNWNCNRSVTISAQRDYRTFGQPCCTTSYFCIWSSWDGGH